MGGEQGWSSIKFRARRKDRARSRERVSLHGQCKPFFSLSSVFHSEMGPRHRGGVCKWKLRRNKKFPLSLCLSYSLSAFLPPSCPPQHTHTQSSPEKKNNPPLQECLLHTVFLLAKFRRVFLVNKCILLSAPFKNYAPCFMPNNLFKY